MKKEIVKQQANGKWYGILSGVGIPESSLTGKHGPCPICGGKDRFRWTDKDGDGGYYCSGCGPGDGVSLVQKYLQLSFPAALKLITQEAGCAVKMQPKKQNPCPKLNKVWLDSLRLSPGDPVMRYLNSRGINEVPADVKYCPKCWDYETKRYYPAMISMIRDRNGKPVSLHRTYLTLSGDKAAIKSPKKVMPGKKGIAGGAVRLIPHRSVLGIAEGIETALSCYELFDIPTWAAISTSGMAAFEPPEVSELVIFADNDSNFAGYKAAYDLAHRVSVQKKYKIELVEVKKPGPYGDFNDMLIMKGSE